jgi:hypothetical protein
MNTVLGVAAEMTLNAWMKKHKIVDWRLAEMTGIDRVSINRLRRGINPPSWPTMIRLAKITRGEVMPNDFLDVAKAKE